MCRTPERNCHFRDVSCYPSPIRTTSPAWDAVGAGFHAGWVLGGCLVRLWCVSACICMCMLWLCLCFLLRWKRSLGPRPGDETRSPSQGSDETTPITKRGWHSDAVARRASEFILERGVSRVIHGGSVSGAVVHMDPSCDFKGGALMSSMAGMSVVRWLTRVPGFITESRGPLMR